MYDLDLDLDPYAKPTAFKKILIDLRYNRKYFTLTNDERQKFKELTTIK